MKTLEKLLGRVPWKSLHHAYGTAQDVPALLRAIASSRRANRRRAWVALNGSVIHQGTVWTVTPHVAAILVAMLSNAKRPPDPEAMLVYLGRLARNIGGKRNGSQTRHVIARATPILRPFCFDARVAVRVAALYALCGPHQALVEAVLDVDEAPLVRGAALLALGEMRQSTRKTRRLADALDARSRVERLSAACGLVVVPTRAITRPESVRLRAVIDDIVHHAEDYEADYAKLPWARGRFDRLIARLVQRATS